MDIARSVNDGGGRVVLRPGKQQQIDFYLENYVFNKTISRFFQRASWFYPRTLRHLRSGLYSTFFTGAVDLDKNGDQMR